MLCVHSGAKLRVRISNADHKNPAHRGLVLTGAVGKMGEFGLRSEVNMHKHSFRGRRQIILSILRQTSGKEDHKRFDEVLIK